jgi:hypothetical protein
MPLRKTNILLIVAIAAISILIYYYRYIWTSFSFKKEIDAIALLSLISNLVIVFLVTILYNKRFSNLKNQKDLLINSIHELVQMQFNEKEALEVLSGLYFRKTQLEKDPVTNAAPLKDTYDQLTAETSKAYSTLTRIKNQRNLIYHLIKTSTVSKRAKNVLIDLYFQSEPYVTSPMRMKLSEIKEIEAYREWMLEFHNLSDANLLVVATMINHINGL